MVMVYFLMLVIIWVSVKSGGLVRVGSIKEVNLGGR